MIVDLPQDTDPRRHRELSESSQHHPIQIHFVLSEYGKPCNSYATIISPSLEIRKKLSASEFEFVLM